MEHFCDAVQIGFILLKRLIKLQFYEIYEIIKWIYFWIFPLPVKSISGKLALVTGGASELGREICMKLAKEGCNLAVVDSDINGAKLTCHAAEKLGIEALPYEVDIGNYEEVYHLRTNILQDLGSVDILVNSACYRSCSSFKNCSHEEIKSSLNVNVTGLLWITHVFIEDMIKRKCGFIVAVSSMSAYFPSLNETINRSCACSIKGFMEGLSQEIRSHKLGIKTLIVYPHLNAGFKTLNDKPKESLEIQKLLGTASPKTIAKAIVEGIRHNSRCISIPGYLLPIARVIRSLPARFEELFFAIVLPELRNTQAHKV